MDPKNTQLLAVEPIPETQEETPLPATLTFVMLMGITFIVLWFGIFALLKERW